MRRSQKIIAAIAIALIALTAAGNVAYADWDDREEVFREHARTCGWPIDELYVAGGGVTHTVFLGTRQYRTWAHPDRPGIIYEIELGRSLPFGTFYVRRAYNGPKPD